MTNNNIYFVANWKMYGNLRSLNTLKKVINFSKLKLSRKVKIVYCPPYTLIEQFIKKTNNSQIQIGAQDCHFINNHVAFTGRISANQLKMLGTKYIILGHSEKRLDGDTNHIINKKIIVATKEKLKVILCVGETLKDKRDRNITRVIKKQLNSCLKKIKKLDNIIIAYEPVWSIGTGHVPTNLEIYKNVNFIKKFLNQKFKIEKLKVLYGGSVNQKNIKTLSKINNINGFLIGGASQSANKLIDIVKKAII